jgi:hypothetical protein
MSARKWHISCASAAPDCITGWTNLHHAADVVGISRGAGRTRGQSSAAASAALSHDVVSAASPNGLFGCPRIIKYAGRA